MMRAGKLVNATVAALEDIKARDIVVLDVRRLTALFDRVVVASADSARQGRALSDNLQEKLKALGAKIYGVEGEQTGEWILVDLGEIVVHIMQPAIRKYYNLEELWAPPPKTRRRKAPRADAREATE
jgi:ribosome-associated protein